MITVTGTPVPREALRDIPLERPANAGPRWRGIPHHELADTVIDGLRRRGIRVGREVWSVDTTGASLVGGVTVDMPAFLGLPRLDGMGYALGLHHTNDMRRAVTFAVGAEVFVCHNGVVTGRFVLRRKHTTGLDLDAEIDGGLDRFVQEARTLYGTVTRLKETRLTEKQSDHLLIEAGRRNLLPWSRVGQVQEEYLHPSYRDFDERTAWGLYNAFTHIAKKSAPHRQLAALDGFRKVLMN